MGIQFADMSGIQMVESIPIVEWSVNRMASEYRTNLMLPAIQLTDKKSVNWMVPSTEELVTGSSMSEDGKK